MKTTESNTNYKLTPAPAVLAARQFSARLKGLRQKVSLVVALAALAGPALGANKYWVGASGDTNNPTSGTWSNGTATVWSDGAVSTGNATWASGDAAFFGGASGSCGIRVTNAISMASMHFVASGYTLTNNTAQTITATGNPYIMADPGTVNIIGTNITLTSGVAGTIGAVAGGTAGGTFIIDSGATVTRSGNVATTINGTGTVVRLRPSGKLNTSSGTGSPLTLGNTVGDDATLIVDGGAVAIQRASSSIWLGSGPGLVSGDIRGTLTITNGGTVTEIGGFVALGLSAGNLGTLNLDGGTLTTAAVQSGGATGTAGAGTSIVNFNGGILKAQQAAPNFVNLITAAYVRNGGVVINNNGFAVTIGQALLHSTNVLDNATDGGLTNLGLGTLSVTNVNTYNGPTMVAAGRLVTTTASMGNGSYSVADNAALEVQVNTVDTSLTNSGLTLGATGNLTNTFTLGANGSQATPVITDTGALNLNGTVTVNVSGSGLLPGTYVLIKYGSLSGAGSFVAGTLPVIPGYTTTLNHNLGSKQLELVFFSPPSPVQWAVGNGKWDTTTFNWKPLGGGPLTNYPEFSSVTFDDSASGASPILVTNVGAHTPGGITNNSTKDYTITGSFGLAGSASLDKSGSGTFTLAVNSTHAGGTFIHAGTLQVGNGGTSGSLGTGDIGNDAALVFNRSDALAVPGIVSGAGTLTKNGNGALTLAGTNSYSGNTLVNAGKLAIITACTGGGSYAVADGATLEVQAAGASDSLPISSLTLGTAGNLTINFALGAGRSQAVPMVADSGALTLNGTVRVNVTGSGMAVGTYVLVQYASLGGSGSFVAGTMPSGSWTVTNDTANLQLKLVGYAGLVWDSGNTNNGATIDPANGTWDLTATNNVWNNAISNVAFTNGNPVIFGGADGAYGIKLGASVTPTALTFLKSGYTLTNDAPQTITLAGNGATPVLVVAGGKTATIGTNVTVTTTPTSFFGNLGDTPGGTLIIENGGLFQETGGNTWALDGAGTVVSVKTGGSLRHAGGGGGQFAIGAGNTGNPATVSVDGGSVQINANNCPLNIGTGAGSVAGTLTLNSGTVSMPAGTTRPVTLGAQPGNIGTVNLNGGTLSVAQVVKGNSSFATNNFNGGTLRAVNGSFGYAFLSGLDRANVRNGGAVIDNGGFAITIGQILEHSDFPGDNVTDGGLASSGTGSLTLTDASTYTGGTTISNGTLALSGAGAIASSASIDVKAGATFDVSTVSFTLGVGQILKGNGTINGSVSANGTIAPGESIGTLTFNNDLTLLGNVAIEVNTSASPSNDLCVVNGALSNGGTGTVTVSNLGPAFIGVESFTLFSQPVSGGGALTIAPAIPGPNLIWTNRLALDGTIGLVSLTATTRTNLTATVSGGTLHLTWPGDHLGWLVQSNSVSLANAGAWFDIPGSQLATNLNVTINPSLPQVFYRMRHP